MTTGQNLTNLSPSTGHCPAKGLLYDVIRMPFNRPLVTAYHGMTTTLPMTEEEQKGKTHSQESVLYMLSNSDLRCKYEGVDSSP